MKGGDDLDHYIVTAWARKLILALFCVVALVWGIRQGSLVYQMWTIPKEKSSFKQLPSIPGAAKSVGEQFLWRYYSFDRNDTYGQKITKLAPLVTQHLQNQWLNQPLLIPMTEEMEPKQISSWNEKWVEVGKSVDLEYQLLLKNGQKIQLHLFLVQSSRTWLVDRLPSLVPPVVKSEETFQPDVKLNEAEQKRIKQAIDGFMDSWLMGRKDANTKSLGTTVPLLDVINGEYKGVEIEPVKEKPLLISATVYIEKLSGDHKHPIILAFSYQLEIEKNKDQYVVKKVYP